MRIIKAPPPNFEAILKVFDVKDKPIVFTYGDCIYNPTDGNIPPHLITHEDVHRQQQEVMGVEVWWDQYLADPKFRLEQEVWAYQAQYAHLKDKIKDKNLLFRFLHKLALDLSGEMYGKILSYTEARKLILNKNL